MCMCPIAGDFEPHSALIVVELTAKRSILVLLSLEYGKNKVISAQKQRVIRESIPLALLPRVVSREFIDN